MGVEPTWLAWKARTLPLSYTRYELMGFIYFTIWPAVKLCKFKIPGDAPGARDQAGFLSRMSRMAPRSCSDL